MTPLSFVIVNVVLSLIGNIHGYSIGGGQRNDHNRIILSHTTPPSTTGTTIRREPFNTKFGIRIIIGKNNPRINNNNNNLVHVLHSSRAQDHDSDDATTHSNNNIKSFEEPNLVSIEQIQLQMLQQQQEQQQERDVSIQSRIRSFWNQLYNEITQIRKLPPIQIEDFNVLMYDMILLVNLAISISYLVIHRLDVQYIGAAFNEGCLMCIVWILSGLYTGAFLNSAVDGHKGSSSPDGGPRGATILAAHTFVNAINLRLLFALIVAVFEHRPVGGSTIIGEQIMQYEIGFGLILMVIWRALHSSYTTRL